MKRIKDTYRSSHSQYKTAYHVVWNTKYHMPVLNGEFKAYLAEQFVKILATMPGCEMIEFNILADHVHIVVMIPPKYAVKDVIGRLKGQSSSKVRRHFPDLKKLYWKDNVVWSPGYYVSTVGIPEKKILSYVRDQ